MLRLTSYLLLLLFMFPSCKQNALTGTKKLTLLSESMLINMANGEYQQFLATNRVLYNPGNRDVDMVRRVGNRIIRAVESFYAGKNMSAELKDFKWEVNLVDDGRINAWCMPGGKIVVYTGLLPVAQNEAALAVVMGHEVSHALLQHGNQRMSNALVQQLGGVALSVALINKPQETRDLFQLAYGVGSSVGVLLPFSRKHELEADRYGLIWAAMAGYNPQEAIGLWQRMEQASGGKTPEFLNTHPSEARRIEKLQQMMPEALQYYQPVQ